MVIYSIARPLSFSQYLPTKSTCNRALAVTALAIGGWIYRDELRVHPYMGSVLLGLISTSVLCMQSIIERVGRLGTSFFAAADVAPETTDEAIVPITETERRQEIVKICQIEIQNAIDPGFDERHIPVPYHCIFGEEMGLGCLGLGNFVSCLMTVECEEIEQYEQSIWNVLMPMRVSGQMLGAIPVQFAHVISMCPLHAIYNPKSVVMHEVEEDFREAFDQKQIKWEFLGRTLIDAPEAWLGGLVHDCTFLDREEYASIDIMEYNIAQMRVLLQVKADSVAQLDVQKWFEPVFSILDKAVFDNQNVLIHCQQGMRRSATVLIAYLINRFDVSAQSAIAYVRSKRGCVDIRFEQELNAYETCLRNARATGIFAVD